MTPGCARRALEYCGVVKVVSNGGRYHICGSAEGHGGDHLCAWCGGRFDRVQGCKADEEAQALERIVVGLPVSQRDE